MSRIFGVVLVVTTLIALMGPATSESVPELEKGRRAFEPCAGCHTLNRDGDHGFGPNLYGIFGRTIASAPNFTYSDGLSKQEGIWDEDRLNRYIARPKLVAPENAMPFKGITSRYTRSALIAWLKSNPDYYDPPLSDFDQMVAEADTVRGASIGRRCLVCHTVAKNGGHSIGPNLRNIIEREIASYPDFDYSERMMRIEGKWTINALNGFLMAPKAFDQGSHRAFQSLTRPMDRAALISWLTTLD